MRYFMHLAYRGTAFSGWQRQSNTEKSIQALLENTLEKMTGQPITIMGCGRTDSGVHAMQYFAHFDCDESWSYDPVERLNRMLPQDVSIYEMIPVHERAHTRYDAIKRSYEYHLHLQPNPFLAPFSAYYMLEELDIAAMRSGLDRIREIEDFRHLCLTPDRFKNTLCKMYQADLTVSEDGLRLCFSFTANRFLKSMIRIIVSRLLALGEGKITLTQFEDINTGNQQLRYRTLAFPQGLHLTKIIYPYLERDVKSYIFNR
ncbi:MAG: tRNA pseudouridine synthase A [Saprospiraceae bacterium]|nr:tRNA pseudouridine synthase A [Saprospiraceae bacterium]